MWNEACLTASKKYCVAFDNVPRCTHSPNPIHPSLKYGFVSAPTLSPNGDPSMAQRHSAVIRGHPQNGDFQPTHVPENGRVLICGANQGYPDIEASQLFSQPMPPFSMDDFASLAKCLHCVRTACILRTQRLGYSPKNTCHLFTRGKTERCQYHRVGQVSIDTSGCSYHQQHRRRRTVRSWCPLGTIEYRRSRAFGRR